MPSKLFHYVDDSRTGVYDIDSMSVYIDYDVAQKVLLMDEQTMNAEAGGGKSPPRTTQVQIKLKPGVKPLAAPITLPTSGIAFTTSTSTASHIPTCSTT